MPAPARRTHRKRYDLACRPKTYWPRGARRGDAVEIARITVASSSADVISVQARRGSDGRIHYRMLHEDAGGRTKSRIRAKPASSAGPLSFGELLALLEGACYAGPCPDEGDDERYGGVIWGTLRLNLESDIADADDHLFLLKVSSRHYRQLESYYDSRLAQWCLANCIEDEDCGKVVRMRRGRFPRKLIALD